MAESSCLDKQNQIKEIFQACPSEQARYAKIIDLGKSLPTYPEAWKEPSHFVPGCQSQMYLHADLKEGKVYFQATSDALISAGLAAILILAYDGESPETILKVPPTYLEDLGISASLTPSRANGLYSIHLKMKQEALRLLLE